MHDVREADTGGAVGCDSECEDVWPGVFVVEEESWEARDVEAVSTEAEG